MSGASVVDLLSQLRRLDIKVWAEGERLRYNAPAGALTPALRSRLLTQKGELLDFLRQAAGAPDGPALVARPRPDGRPPASFAQERLWFLEQVAAGRPLYNVPTLLGLRGPLHVGALGRSLAEIVRRHEVLRTTFTMEGGRLLQVIAPAGPVALPLLDLRQLPAPEREAEARRQIEAEARRPFSLAEGPLVRFLLLALESADHLLLLTMHHIVADGWATRLFLAELSRLYAAFAAGRPSPLAPLPLQYADYALWQREWLQGERWDRQLAYWKRQLAAPLPDPPLTADHARPAVQSYRGGAHTFDLTPDLTAALPALARREGVTLFMLLLAAFQTLLYRYSGQCDIIVGSPVANRNRAEVENLIGFFANTVAWRSSLAGDPSFRALLGQVRETVLAGQEHQELPFEQLVEALGPRRSPGYHPIFQVMFVLEESPLPALTLPGIEARLLPVAMEVAQFDLTLFVEQHAGSLRATLEYNADLFEAATAARLAGGWQTLLAGIVEDPERPLSALPLLTPAERRQLAAWNETEVPYRPDPVHRLFEAQAARTPAAVAVEGEREQLTYAELNRRAERLAQRLRRLGVGPESLVGICLERSPELVVALLAVLKAGGAYVPLDPTYPRERLAFMCADAAMPLLLTRPSLARLLPDYGGRLLYVAGQAEEAAESVVEAPGEADGALTRAEEAAAERVVETAREVETTPGEAEEAAKEHAEEAPGEAEEAPDEAKAAPEGAERAAGEAPGDWSRRPAYVIYTSGSQGRPKGVLLTHGGLSNLVQAQIEAFRVGPGSRLLQFVSPSFDVATSDIFMALCAGATLHLAPDNMLLAGAGLTALLAERRISHIQLPVSVLEAVPPADLPHLQTIVVGGEACPPGLVARWAPGRRFFNAYGPTEATVCATFERCRDDGRAPTIGRPLANTRIYLLDERRQPVPVGAPGEIYIGGAGLAREYLNRPELTAERFIELPAAQARRLGAAAGERLYRTGDLARYLPDGRLVFLGRTDRQVKIRGFRVEPGEIEAALLKHPAVRQALVLAREDVPGGLVAYLVPAGRERPAPARLRRRLAAALPRYMIPDTFVFLQALPLTPNGKVDRDALPPPDLPAAAAGRRTVPPRDVLELEVARLWEEVLRRPSIGVTDNFFDLGGHSLGALELLARIQEQVGREIPLALFMEEPTVEHLAACLRSRAAGLPASGPAPAAVALRVRGNRPPFFCVHPAGGTVFPYLELSRRLGPEQPFYGLQAAGLYGSRPPIDSIEEMAAYYLESVRALQPAGPYYLGGWSMGGVVAFEMARRLERQGETVALLALLDTQAPGAPGPSPLPDRAQLLADFVRQLADGDALPSAEAAAGSPGAEGAASLPSAEGAAALERILEQAQAAHLLPPDAGPAYIRRLFEVFQTNIRAMLQYTPQAYAGRLTLFRSESEEAAETTMGWSRLAAGPVEVVSVAGNHYTMLTAPHVRSLATRLAARLAAGVEESVEA